MDCLSQVVTDGAAVAAGESRSKIVAAVPTQFHDALEADSVQRDVGREADVLLGKTGHGGARAGSDLIATLPDAVVARSMSLTPQLVAALPPFQITYDLKVHWHRRFDNDPRQLWLREQLLMAFKRRRWLVPPRGPAPFLEL